MDYEGLEVAEKPQKPLKVQKAHKRFSDAPEVVQEEKQFVLRSKDHDGLFYDDGLEPTSKFLHHRICGTRRVMIWMIVLLLVVVGAVTIGVGVSQSKKSGKSLPPTATSSAGAASKALTTTSFAPTSSTISSAIAAVTSPAPFPTCGCGVLPNACPSSIDQTQYISTVNAGKATYKYICGDDFGNQASNPRRNNIFITNTTSINECIDECTTWNHPQNPRPCLGISFHANLSFIIHEKGYKGNCFLKQNVSRPRPFISRSASGGSALLIQ